MEVYCGLCGGKSHQLFGHLREVHEMGPDRYQERCPGAPLISEDLAAYLKENRIEAQDTGLKKRVELFGVEFLADILPDELVPEVDDAYVFQEELARQVLVSLKASERILLVGPTGCGKSTLVEQLAARLNWPVVRVAASGGLTESDLLGEWTVRDGQTIYNYGFLPRAMPAPLPCFNLLTLPGWRFAAKLLLAFFTLLADRPVRTVRAIPVQRLATFQAPEEVAVETLPDAYVVDRPVVLAIVDVAAPASGALPDHDACDELLTRLGLHQGFS